MRNIWFILRRDLKRLIINPAAWVIIFGLTFIPALYAWFNIIGFWNPYGNTKGITVAVANEDAGADNAMMGKLELGDQIESTLKENHELGWTFLGKAKAMECVESGHCYAAIVIPRNFSENMAAVITGSGQRPTLEYYVNEKVNAVAPKMTDVGANTVDRQVNSAFVSTVSKAVTDTINTTNVQITQEGNATVAQTVAKLDATKANLSKSRTMIADLRKTLDGVDEKTTAAKQALAGVDSAATSASQGLTSASGLLTKTQGGITSFSNDLSTELDQGGNLFLQASGKASTSATRVANGVLTASGATGSALNELTSVNKTNAQILADLKALPDNPLSEQINEIVTDLSAENEKVAQTLQTLTTLNDSTTAAANSTLGTVDQFSATSTTTVDALSGARNTINSSAIPQLNSGLATLSGTAGTLSGFLTGTQSLTGQTNLILDQLTQICQSTSSSLNSTDDLLGKFITRIDTVTTDLKTLENTNVLSDLLGSKNGTLDASRIASFMLSPTVLDTHTLYPIDTYGSGMAPLFTSLALWVGVFMLMVLFKLEVDNEGLEGRHVTTNQTYMARYLLLAIVAGLQGIVCAVGDLIIRVQCANRFVFILTAWLTSLAYLAIAYALSATFMHVGKALVVALVMLQIPGASGLYPIEMMPDFYRALYPFFPFTYSINAFRETIAGFYDGDWLTKMLMLALFTAIAFFVGLVVRPWLGNFNHLFAREVHEGDMIVGERVYMPANRFDLAQALHVLADHGEYRRRIERRAKRFATLYPRLMRGALVAGFAVPIVLFIVFSFVGASDGSKLVALATWIAWILIIIIFLMTVESIRESLRRQTELGSLSEDSLRDMIMAQGVFGNNRHHITVPADELRPDAASNSRERAEKRREEPDLNHREDTLDLNLNELRKPERQRKHRGSTSRRNHHDGRHSA